MIIVTGATGRLGSAVVESLLARVPADQVGVSVRDPERAAGLARRGVRVRRGDFTDAGSLVHAFEGASRVLIVSSGGGIGEAIVRGHRTAVDAAVAAGVERIVYTSQMASGPTSLFPPMLDHAATETALRESGIRFTSLRNGFYASSALMLLRGVVETGQLAVPEDGPVAWTDHADLADAAALAMTTDEFDGATPSLTAAETLDMDGVAQIAAQVTGRPIRRVVVSDEDYRSGLRAHGLPEWSVDTLSGMFAASRQGEFAPADPTLGRVLGRDTVGMRDVLEGALAPAPS